MTDDALRSILAKTPVASAAEVLNVLSSIVDALPVGDGIWCFSRLYQAVTHDVAAAVAAAQFRDRSWLDQLDATFANLFPRAADLSSERQRHTTRVVSAVLRARKRQSRAAVRHRRYECAHQPGPAAGARPQL